MLSEKVMVEIRQFNGVRDHGDLIIEPSNVAIRDVGDLSQQQIIDLAASIGETPDSLFGLKPKKGSKSPPKFRHPDDPALTWTGRGKSPRWITELEQAGHKRDEYLIE